MSDKDFVDTLIQEWLETVPTLDLSGLPIIARIVRMSHYISQFIDANLARYNLNVGEFEVLAALARILIVSFQKNFKKSLFPPVGYLTELID